MKIFLTGFMGSGKTHLGGILAVKMHISFFDMDHCIEAEMGMTVPEIFESQGEAVFRIMERNTLESLVNQKVAMVISTGGGTPCFFKNMKFMNAHGITVFLDTPVSTLVQRLAPDIKKRPVLKGQTLDSLSTFVETLISKRRIYYEQSQLIIKDIDPETIIAQIVDFTQINH